MIDAMPHLGRKSDRDDDDKARAALTTLHAVMRKHVDSLVIVINRMAEDEHKQPMRAWEKS